MKANLHLEFEDTAADFVRMKDTLQAKEYKAVIVDTLIMLKGVAADPQTDRTIRAAYQYVADQVYRIMSEHEVDI